MTWMVVEVFREDRARGRGAKILQVFSNAGRLHRKVQMTEDLKGRWGTHFFWRNSRQDRFWNRR